MKSSLTILLAIVAVVELFIIVGLLAQRRIPANIPEPASSGALQYPVGIEAVRQPFIELAPAGKSLPYVHSRVFTTQFDNQSSVQVAISQKRPAGTEQVAFLVIKVSPRTKGTLNIVVTLDIDANKQMRLKTTVSETGVVQQFGPYPVM